MRTREGYNFEVDAAYVEDMLEEFNMSALKSTPTLRWERRETDEKGATSERAECVSPTSWTTVVD